MTSSGPASKTPAAVARMTFRLLPSALDMDMTVLATSIRPGKVSLVSLRRWRALSLIIDRNVRYASGQRATGLSTVLFRRLTVLSTAGHSVRDKKDILRFAFVALDSPHSHSAVLLSQNCTSLPISWTNNAHDRWLVSPFARTSLDLVCIECGPKDPCPCPSPVAL
ncbi:hypothetical protein ACLKA6_013437 [Drosophila palustris]